MPPGRDAAEVFAGSTGALTGAVSLAPLIDRLGRGAQAWPVPLSHAAIVAREFGLPAVVGAGGAMSCLTDGLRVTVDGGSGTVGRG